jgi:hypothetical protein
MNFLFFLFIGIPLLLASQVTDTYYFMVHLYHYNQQKLHSERIFAISVEAFNTLEAVI